MFFFVSKVVWGMLQPSSLVLIFLLGALLAAWFEARRAGLACLLAATAICLCGVTPLPNILMLPLEERFTRATGEADAVPVDGILILGGGEEALVTSLRGAHGLNEAAERITEGLALSRRWPKARVVFTGGSAALFGNTTPEGRSVLRMFQEMGLDPDRMTIEDRSRTTWENAVLTKEILTPKPGERWLLVTSAFHMPRSVGVFRAAGFRVDPWPVDYRTTSWGDVTTVPQSMAEGLRVIEIAIREYVGLVAYWLTGRTSALFPAPCPGNVRACL